MKKIITTFAMALMLGTQLHAQPTQQSNETEEFSLRYKVNLARLISTYDNNHDELVKLRQFMDGAVANDGRRIVRVEIWGYASPDGSDALNERLSTKRATDCCEYLRRQYPMMDTIPCETKGIAQRWISTKSTLENSSTPMKSQVVAIVDSGNSSSTIQQKLMAIPSAWSYIKEAVLPPMRCVEIFVVQQTMPEKEATCAAKPAPKSECQPQPACKPTIEEVVVMNNYYVITKREPSRLMALENDYYAPLDFPCNGNDRFKMKDRRRKAKVKEEIRNTSGRHKYLWKSW